jgi:hypothetical protein
VLDERFQNFSWENEGHRKKEEFCSVELVGWSVGRQLDRLSCHLIGWSVGQSLARLVGYKTKEKAFCGAEFQEISIPAKTVNLSSKVINFPWIGVRDRPLEMPVGDVILRPLTFRTYETFS